MKTFNIFLAEDDPGDNKLITRFLRKSSFDINVISVDDGEKARKYLFDKSKNNSELDLIILDLNLPKISGHKILKEIKSHNELKIIPVLILTTSNANTDIVESYKNYASGYFVKPFDLSEWERIILSITDYWLGIVKLPQKEKI